MNASDCSNCRYFHADNTFAGRCHRHAPQPVVLEISPSTPVYRNSPMWPHVSAQDWCGEWVGQITARSASR